jgi:oxygen-independent coproporphyrinogen-3 oxidase
LRGVELSADDLLRREVIGALMCSSAVDFAAVAAVHGVEFREYFATEIDALTPLAADGLVEVGADSITVTARGRLLVRTIAMVFDRHLREQREHARYSRVI